ncbi:MAG: ATP-binding protein [Nitriliruptoraceae bacterium]
MPDALSQQALLEIALSLAGDPDPPALLSRALPLLVRRTGSSACGVIALHGDAATTVQVTPRILARHPTWLSLLPRVVSSAREREGLAWDLAAEDDPGVHHVFRLPGYGLLVLTRAAPLAATSVTALVPVMDVLARPLVAAREQHRRRTVEDDLAALEDRQQGLLDALPFPAWMLDLEGRYLEVNLAFAAWIGRDRDAVVGRSPAEVLPDRLGRSCVAAAAEVVATNRSVREEHRDDRLGRTFEHDHSPYHDATGAVRGVVGFRREITDRVEALRRLQQQSDLQEVLMDLAVGFVNTPIDQLDVAIDGTLARIGTFADADRAYVFRYDFDLGTASNTHEWCAAGITPQIDELQDVPLELVPDWVATHRRGRSMHVPDVTALPADNGIRRILEPQGVVTLLALPIAVAGECLGFVGFDVVAGRRDWSATEHQLLRVLAELLANAELRRRYERALIEAQREEMAARDRMELALEAVDDAVWEWQADTELTYYSSAVFRLVGRDETATTSDEGLLATLLSPADREQVLAQATAALEGGESRFETEVHLQHVDGHQVPVRIGGVVVRDDAGAPVRMAGLVVDLTRQQREAEQQRRRAEAEAVLARISARFVGFEVFDAALEEALADLADSYGASRAYLAQRSEEELLCPTHQWCREGVSAITGRAGGVLPGDDLEQLDRLAAGKTLRVDDARELAASQPLPDARSVLAQPLLVGGRLEGVLGLEHIERAAAWSEDDAALLRAAAEIVAGALARTRTERALVAAREQAEVANDAKTRFLSTISHELRTPMAGVLGMTELLLAGELGERQRAYVSAARDAANSLLLLVGDLLDIARIEQRRLELVPGPTDLSGLLQGVVTAARVTAEPRGLELGLRIDPALPAWVRTDGARVRQIVTNLVGNAVRFTEQGSVQVTATRELDADERAVLGIEVRDTGVGIPLDRQREVFEPFAQVDPSPTRRVGGSGLGLSIVRELVGLLGGELSLESAPGVGTRIRVLLPLEEAAPPEPSEEVSSAPVPTGVRVLVAEDNPINQEVLRGYLEGVADVEVVSDGRAAVEVARAGALDVVLMDCSMPVLDGLAAARAIRALASRAGEVPIVAVTADGSDAHAQACRAAGMDAVLVKPFDRAALLGTLAAAVPARPPTTLVDEDRGPAEGQPLTTPIGADRDLAEGQPQAASGPGPSPVLDPAALRAMAGRRAADGPLADRLLALFAELAPGYVAELASSADAVDLERFRVAAHSLRSSAATLGLVRLSEVCALAEEQALAGQAPPGGFTGLARSVGEELERARAALAEVHPPGGPGS